MVLVASEPIEAGGEIRINYEDGNTAKAATYWGSKNVPGQPHESDAWRWARRHPPPPAARAERIIDGLAQLQRAAAAAASSSREGGLRQESVESGLLHELREEGASGAPLPWKAARGGGDARLRVLVPLLAAELPALKEPTKPSPHWGIVATHLPGRSGRACRERWLLIKEPAVPRAPKPRAVPPPSARQPGPAQCRGVPPVASSSSSASTPLPRRPSTPALPAPAPDQHNLLTTLRARLAPEAYAEVEGIVAAARGGQLTQEHFLVQMKAVLAAAQQQQSLAPHLYIAATVPHQQPGGASASGAALRPPPGPRAAAPPQLPRRGVDPKPQLARRGAELPSEAPHWRRFLHHVTVPAEAVPMGMLAVTIPGGEVKMVKVPKGLLPGQTLVFEARVMAATMPPRAPTAEVIWTNQALDKSSFGDLSADSPS